jgi:VIT1/CCC1 family predicted Fe2+/Mn2+ transporter
LKFDENVYVEDEEIYQRMKKMKTAMVDVWAYTEVTHSRQQYVSQKYRWLRGDYQLMLRNKNILNIIIAGVSAFLPIFLFSVAFYFVKSNIVSTIYCIACMFLLGFVMSEESFDIKEIFNGMFIHTLVFIDVVILRSGMNLNNWTRDTPDTSK